MDFKRKPENSLSRYRAKTLHIGFRFNIETSKKIREKYNGDITEMNARAKELFLKDLEEKL